MRLPFTDKRVLLTGAGGSIGAALAKEIHKHHPAALILLDHSEGNLHQINLELSRGADANEYFAILGDVTDAALLAEIFEEWQPELVIHAAAHKHVPLMETNVLAAVRNNAVGTNHLARMAASYEVGRLVLISTDKAVNPRSVMGATKRAAELAVLRWSTAGKPMRAVRLGNVLGSQGSVVPAFRQQIAMGGPLRVTHPQASRYFFTMEETVELIVLASSAEAGGIFIPRPRPAVLILDLAARMLHEAAADGELSIVITGLRPGDKLREEFASPLETVSEPDDAQLQRVQSPEPPYHLFDEWMAGLQAASDERDVLNALEWLCRLVPEYRPSETALSSARKQESRSR